MKTLEQAVVTLKLKLLDMFAAPGRVYFCSEQYQEFDRLATVLMMLYQLILPLRPPYGLGNRRSLWCLGMSWRSGSEGEEWTYEP